MSMKGLLFVAFATAFATLVLVALVMSRTESTDYDHVLSGSILLNLEELYFFPCEHGKKCELNSGSLSQYDNRRKFLMNGDVELRSKPKFGLDSHGKSSLWMPITDPAKVRMPAIVLRNEFRLILTALL
jgi:hypothetical protein